LIAADEQAHALALTEPEDADRHLEQLLTGDLHEQIPGQGLDDVHQPLGVMTVGRKGRTSEDPVDLLAQDRDLARAGLVGGCRVEAEEAPFADHLPAGSELAHADVVEIDRPMHAGARVGLGQDERSARLGKGSPLALQELGRARRRTPQDAQARSRPSVDRVVSNVIFPVAQEGEVVLAQPLQERSSLGDVVTGAGRRGGGQLGGERRSPAPHRRPVLHGGAHLLEHELDTGLQNSEPVGIRLARQLGVDDGLDNHPGSARPRRQHRGQLACVVTHHPDHRVDDQLDRVPLPAELHGHRVDQERHVVGHDLHHRVRRAPPVAL